MVYITKSILIEDLNRILRWRHDEEKKSTKLEETHEMLERAYRSLNSEMDQLKRQYKHLESQLESVKVRVLIIYCKLYTCLDAHHIALRTPSVCSD
jgi:predicted  nucleic acid-binding Zn-ribbon protein